MKYLYTTFVLIAAGLLMSCSDSKNRVIEQLTTPDGHEFHFMEIDEKGVTDITVRIAWPSDWAYSGEKNPMVPYVGQQMILSDRTASLSSAEILEAFNKANANGFLEIRPNNVIGELSFPKEHVEETVTIAQDLLSEPQFSENWFNRIKGELRKGLQKNVQMSAHIAFDKARSAVIEQRSLVDFLGLNNIENLDNVSLQHLKDWHLTTFTRQPEAIVVTGAISSTDAGRVVDRLLANLPADRNITLPPLRADFSSKTIKAVNPNSDKTYLALIWPFDRKFENADWQNLLLTQYLSEPEKGPLFEQIRTKLRASYGFSAGQSAWSRDISFAFIAGEVDPEKVMEVQSVINEILASIPNSIDKKRFDVVRTTLADSFADNIEFVDISAHVLMELSLDDQDPKAMNDLPDLIRGISSEKLDIDTSKIISVIVESE